MSENNQKVLFRFKIDQGKAIIYTGDKPHIQANKFLNNIRSKHLSPHTLRAYGIDIIILLRWLKRKKISLQSLTQSDLVQWILEQMDHSSQPQSVNRRLSSFELFFKFCFGKSIPNSKGALLPAPYYKRSRRDRYLGLTTQLEKKPQKMRVKVPKKLIEPLTPLEVQKFQKTLHRYRDKAIVTLMLEAGLRSGEVLSLNVSDIDFESNSIKVWGKGSKERMIPLSLGVKEAIQNYLLCARPKCAGVHQLFLVHQGKRLGLPMSAAGIRSLFRYRQNKTGINKAHPHRWRHTLGANLAFAGVPLQVIQKIFGHSDPKTTLRYIELSLHQVKEHYEKAMQIIKSSQSQSQSDYKSDVNIKTDLQK